MKWPRKGTRSAKHIAVMRLLRLFAATLFSHCVTYAAAPSVRRIYGKTRPVTAVGVHALRDEYTRPIQPSRARAAKTFNLERPLSDLVNQVRALTPAEIGLMWKTAPPRMPAPAPAT